MSALALNFTLLLISRLIQTIGAGLLVTIQTFFSSHSAFIGARAFFIGIIMMGIIQLIIDLMLKPIEQLKS
ncbi:MAG: hypothetical protein ABF991_13880 [Liquorilactobacillus hordei]|uniref:hypothetical protein n=1 Tax=Liquorilactobacillus hordei TaxID=468911 RepID=UPI0039EB3B8F